MRRILVVDDELHIGLAIRAWMVQHGFRVTIADGGTNNGLAALDTSNFDLMIVDVFMPHMRGFDSIRLFHQRAPSVPLVAISRYAFSDFEMSGADLREDGGNTRRDALSAQALPAGDIARRDRRMRVGSRAAPKICSHPVRGHQRSVRAAARRERRRWDEGGGNRAMNKHEGCSASGGGHAANSRR